MNDFGPLTDAPTTPPYSGAHLLPLGLEAFLDYTPIETAPTLYRSLRWGRHLELFVLDTRRYRDANSRRTPVFSRSPCSARNSWRG